MTKRSKCFYRRTSLLFLIFLLHFSINSSAQEALHLLIRPGARINALGGAGTAVSAGFWGIFYNPAGLVYSRGVELGYYKTNYMDSSNEFSYLFLGFSRNIPGIGTAGISYTELSFGDFVYKDEMGNVLDSEKIIKRAFSFSFAGKFSSKFSLGANLKYIIQEFPITFIVFPVKRAKSNSIAFDFGVLYRGAFAKSTYYRSFSSGNFLSKLRFGNPTQGFSFGFALRNIGSKAIWKDQSGVQLNQDDEGFPLPTVLALGIGYTPIIYGDYFYVQIMGDLEKHAVRYIEDEDKWDPWQIAIFSSWKDFGISDAMIGTEIGLLKLTALRFGFHKIYDNVYFKGYDFSSYGVRLGPRFANISYTKIKYPDNIALSNSMFSFFIDVMEIKRIFNQ